MSLTKIALTTAAAIAILAPTVTAANAGHNNKNRYQPAVYKVYTPGIDRRIANQRRRIRNARIDGDLTFREVRKLRRKLRRIRQERRYAKMDGRVTRYERRELHAMLNANSRRINRLRHNSNTASSRFRKFRRTFY